MFVLNRMSIALALCLSSAWCLAEPQKIVAHEDPIIVDESLNLTKLIDLTLEKYPDTSWLKSLEDEARAIDKRSQSWTAGSIQTFGRFQEATSGTLHYFDTWVEVPLWNLGQRDAEHTVSEKAQASAEMQMFATKLRVAGLVRAALWDMELQKIRYDQAVIETDFYEKLTAKIERRVELGDLPRSDLLLAKTELLQKRSTLITAEAELMHARKRYQTITQTTKVPKTYREKLVELKSVEQTHPALVSLGSQIERKRAEIESIRLIGSGQSNVAVGVNGDMGDSRSNKTASFNVAVMVPFGGEDHLAPQIAAANVELNKLLAERDQLYRDLQQAHHEAEHNLEVNKAELDNANQLNKTAKDLLIMSSTAFSVGEIDLLDLLKIQAKAQQAELNAKERAVMLERDIALYNQAVGVLP